MFRSISNLIRTETPIQLPKSTYQLRIISLSFNRSDTHQLLSSTYHPSFHHQSTHFKLISIHPSHVSTHTNPILSHHIKSLSSCFSLTHQLKWNLKRFNKIHQLKKPRYQLRLSFSLKIKNTHQSAVIRKSLRKNWIAALKLILQYGVEPIQNQSNLLSLNVDLANPQLWLLKDYYYVVHPYVSLYQLTVPQLVPFIQSALLSILDQSKQQQTNPSIHQYKSQHPSPIPQPKQQTHRPPQKQIHHTTFQHPSLIPHPKQQTHRPQKRIHHTTSQHPSSIPEPKSQRPSIPKSKS